MTLGQVRSCLSIPVSLVGIEVERFREAIWAWDSDPATGGLRGSKKDVEILAQVAKGGEMVASSFGTELYKLDDGSFAVVENLPEERGVSVEYHAVTFYGVVGINENAATEVAAALDTLRKYGVAIPS